MDALGRVRLVSRLSLLFAGGAALAACNGLITNDPGTSSASAPASPAPPTPSCDRPPAVFSRGAYPANIENVATSDYGLVGQIAQVHADIPACQSDSPANDDNTFRIDRIAWPAGDSAFLAPSTISLIGPPGAAPGASMFVYGSGGTFGSGPGEGCTAVAVAGLDLAQYPNAPSDMLRLRAFVADRATYDGLRAAMFVVEATVTAAGDPVYSNSSGYPSSRPETSVLLTLQTNTVVCGTPGATLAAWYVQHGYGGRADPLGEQPVVGWHGVFVVRSDSVDHTLTIDAVSPSTDAARLSALLSTPPALAL